jgi:hypothetical protein
MNAAIRAVTRAGIYNQFQIKGIYRGYDGLIKGEVKPFTTENVSGIIGRGGTILKTARSKEFMTLEGMQKAYETCQKEEIDALVVIGGNGSLTGARNFGMEFNFPVIGLPGTIDNDLYGTDSTIGYDTTMNTIMECVDRIRDTANSHERIFFVEVMGRDAGFLAQNSAIACGAEAAIIPEEMMEEDQLAVFMGRGIRKSKKSCIVIVSESPKCGALYYADRVRKEFWQTLGAIAVGIILLFVCGDSDTETTAQAVAQTSEQTAQPDDFIEQACKEYEQETGRKIYPKGREFIRNGAIKKDLQTVDDVYILIVENSKFMWKDNPITIQKQ